MDRLTGDEDRRRRAARVAVLTGALLLVYLIAIAPHLVHHLFEEEHGRPTCPLLIQSQQTTLELQPALPAMGPSTFAGMLPDQGSTGCIPDVPAHASQPRAPPHASPSA